MSSIILLPVRCYSCNYPIGRKQFSYEALIAEGYSPGDAMDILGIFRLCCRMNVMNPAVIPFGAENQDLLAIESRLRSLTIESRRETSMSAPLTAMQNPQSVQGIPANPGEESYTLPTNYPSARIISDKRSRPVKAE